MKQNFPSIHDLLELSDHELKAWLEVHETDSDLPESIKGMILFWKKNNKSLSSLRQFGTSPLTIQKRRNKKTIYSIAASLIFLLSIVGISYYTFSIRNKIEPKEYYIKDQGLPVFMAEPSDTYARWMNAYKMGEFEKALQLMKKKPVSDTTFYYTGVILMEEKEWTDAISSFNKISIQSSFYEASCYYMAYSHLALKQYHEAEILFKKVPPASLYFPKAQQAISAIDKKSSDNQ